MSSTKTILVTGAAGYLASWIVAQLLDAGHQVHGTVRQLQDTGKLQHLLDLTERHPGQLTLFEADLLAPGSFDAATQGCSVVIHTASPYFLGQAKDPQRHGQPGGADQQRGDAVQRCLRCRRRPAVHGAGR